MSNANRHWRIVWCAAAVLAGGCFDSGEPTGGTPQARANLVTQADAALQAFASCDDYKDYVADALTSRYTTEPFWYGAPEVLVDRGNAYAEDDADAGGDVPDDVSETNVQEEGVDEADIVKTAADGTMFVIQNGVLTVLDAFPPQDITTAATLDLETWAYDMYLDDAANRLVVIGQSWGQGVGEDRGGGGGASDPGIAVAKAFADAPAVEVVFIDVRDRAQPQVTSRQLLEGYTLSSRRVDARVHLVTRFDVPLPAALETDESFWRLVDDYQRSLWEDTYGDETDDAVAPPEDDGDGGGVATCEANDESCGDPAETTCRDLGDCDDTVSTQMLLAPAAAGKADVDAIAARIAAAVAATPVGELLPRLRTEAAGQVSDTAGLSCAAVFRPAVEIDPGLLVVSSFNTDGAARGAVAVMNNAWLTYASSDNLYVVQNSQGWWWAAAQESQSAIYKFAIGAGDPQYQSTGLIDGWVNGSYAMSEFAGYLRVAATEEEWNDGRDEIVTRNHLFVLEDDGAGTLSVTGSVRDLAPGERIFSSRFLGDRGFVVTYRQVDPLFAFDLSDPHQPRKVGELHIPGFSTYIHPFGDDFLITVGRDGDEQGNVGGLAISLFDVSDLAAPRLVERVVPTVGSGDGWSWSAAEYDPHAFTFYAPENLLAIPVVYADWTTTAVGDSFAGVIAFRVAASGFTELGRVDHVALAQSRLCGGAEVDPSCGDGGYVWAAEPTRSVVMQSGDDTFLYSLSTAGVVAADVADLDTTLGSVAFPDAAWLWWY